MALNQHIYYNRRKGTGGIGGQIYEIELSMLLLLNCMKNKKITRFYLASNMEEAADFDDAVVKYQYNDGGLEKSKVIFIQAKHRENEKKKITIDTFLSPKLEGQFILRKYLSSFVKIKYIISKSTNHPLFSDSLDDCELLIYTNVAFNRNNRKNHIIETPLEANHILNIDGQYGRNSYYQLGATDEVMNALRFSLDYEIFVKELSQTILSKHLDITKPIFNFYHFHLKENVVQRINASKGEFRKEFLKNNQDILNSIFEEIGNKIDTVNSTNDLQNYLAEMTIELPEKFGNVGENDLHIVLPPKIFEDIEIKSFLARLKLFVSQPNERELEQLLQDTIKSIYNLHDNTVFSVVKDRVLNWWREGNYYLTERDTIFQDAAKVCIWFNVKSPTELFIGREKEVEELHNKINRSQRDITVTSQITSVSGLGGIGKTQLVRRYIKQFVENYDSNIIWINAENEAALSKGFIILANEKLNINTKSADGNGKSINSIIDDVYLFFSGKKCLFVFDNADNCNDFKEFLPLRSLKPSDQRPYILITSRVREWDRGIEVMDLYELDSKNSVKLVKIGLNIQNNDHDEGIKQLVKELQYFPLAILQSIAYIENRNGTEICNISTLVENKIEEILKSNKLLCISDDYIETTITTWKTTLDKIGKDENGHRALEVLTFMSYIASEKIYINMFVHLTNSAYETRLAVGLLLKYSMVSGKLQQNHVSIHRLVQEVTRIEKNNQNQQAEFLQKTFDLLYENISRVGLLPHLRIFSIHIEKWIPQQQHILMKNKCIEHLNEFKNRLSRNNFIS